MTIVRTNLHTTESARRTRFEPAGDIVATNVQKAIEEAEADAEAAVALLRGQPIFILATGQSNFVQNAGTGLSPPTNAFVWNNTTGTDGANGTAFTALSAQGSFTVPDAFAIRVARAHPERNVYILNVSFGAQSIAHWMVGSSAPDAYQNITNNISLALTAAGVTKIDILLWWQGENQTATPETYVADWETVLARFKAETWFPRVTPVLIYGLIPESFTASAVTQKTDTTNSRLQEIVQREPDTRRFVYTGLLEVGLWDGTLHLGASGVEQSGLLTMHAYEHGPTNGGLLNPLSRTLRGQVYGRPANRNLLYAGDFTTNSWRFGTTFTGPTTGTRITDDFTWLTSGAGVVDILKTADAPTLAQSGMFTQHCLHVDVTTADASLAGADYYGLEVDIPALNASFLGFGQTGAVAVSFSFWVKSTITGNYFVALQNSAQNRYYVSQYTVAVADTWEKKQITIPGDATGTWLYSSGVGLRAFFTLAASDAHLFTPEVWGAADVRVGNVTRANAMSSTSNNFKLALVQIEEGKDFSVFDRRPGIDGSITTPIHIGGIDAGSTAEIRSTSAAGSGDLVKITGGTNGGTTVATFLGTGNAGIGSTAPSALLHVNRNTTQAGAGAQASNVLFYLTGADASAATLLFDVFGNVASFNFRRANNTAGSPSALSSGDVIATFGFQGYGATGYVAGSKVRVVAIAAESWTDTVSGASFAVETTPTGGTTKVEAMRVQASGGLAVGTTSDPGTGMIYTNAATFMIRTKTSYSNGAAAAGGTLLNAPAAGNPTKWIPVDDNGTTRYVPAW